MSLEQQISSLNENVGNLISATEKLTNKVENKIQEYNDWKTTIIKPNPIVLKVGIDKEFRHPVDAAAKIASGAFAGDVLWRMEIDPGVYDFPYKGVHEVLFSYFKNVQVVGRLQEARYRWGIGDYIGHHDTTLQLSVHPDANILQLAPLPA